MSDAPRPQKSRRPDDSASAEPATDKKGDKDCPPPTKQARLENKEVLPDAAREEILRLLKQVPNMELHSFVDSEYASDADSDDDDDANKTESAYEKLEKYNDAASKVGEKLEAAPEELKADKEFMLQIVRVCPAQYYKTLPASLQKDPDLFHAALSSVAVGADYEFFEHMPEELRESEDLQFWQKTVSTMGRSYEIVPEELRKNRDITLAALKDRRFGGSIIMNVPEELKADREIVMETFLSALQGFGAYVHQMTAEAKGWKMVKSLRSQLGIDKKVVRTYRNDREVAIKAVQVNGHALYFASQRLRNDRDIVQLAVGNNGLALRHASRKFRNDKDIVLQAVQNQGKALKYASRKLRGDRDVVLAAVQNDKKSFKHALKKMRVDPAILIAKASNNNAGGRGKD